jgi:CubicO group peptidase (beta-lactamase class C family)
MSAFSRKTMAACLCCALLQSAAAGAWTNADKQWADNYLVRATMRSTPTIAACIAKDGMIIYSGAAGNIAPGVKATPQTIYRIGSVSKQFTAAGILALIEDGATVPTDNSKFAISSNVSLFFPGVQSWSVGGVAPMTVKRLATMTSNLPSYTANVPMNLDPTKAVSSNALLAGILKFSLTGPLYQYNYSNTNYFLLANIIERLPDPASGSASLIGDYKAYLRKRIFARANLVATNFIDDPAPLGPMAPPTYQGQQEFQLPSWSKGAGAIQTNALDMCAWDSQLIAGKVIKPASVAVMGTGVANIGPGLVPSDPEFYYAMGWAVQKFPTYLEYSHSGDISGYTAFNLIDLVGGHTVSVTLLTNQDSFSDLNLIGLGLAQRARQ